MLTCRFAALTLLLLGVILSSMGSKDSCDICKEAAKKFGEEFNRTKGMNFGGGNTAWEEKALGNYAKSETRLVEIMDKMCVEKDYECAGFLEEFEEPIEEFWQEIQTNQLSFFQQICIQKAKVCCQDGKFGKKCTPCPGGARTSCSGQGVCQGAGSRSGKGTCKCNEGYTGKLCDQCQMSHFRDGRTNISCAACNPACHNCTAPGVDHCIECKSGYERVDSNCVDINECERSQDLCKVGKYCMNLPGSHRCAACDQTCSPSSGCVGVGSRNCVECKDGYLRRQDTQECLDVDECADPVTSSCPTNTWCQNTPGAYNCSACDSSCDASVGCSFGGPNGCKSCAVGYQRPDPNSGCEDINECVDSNICAANFTCINLKGGHTCKCEPPKRKVGDACLSPPEKKKKKEKKVVTEPEVEAESDQSELSAEATDTVTTARTDSQAPESPKTEL